MKTDDKLVLVDVGGLGGLKEEWKPYFDQITPIIFEPNPRSAVGLRAFYEDELGGRVIEAALDAEAGHKILHLTASPGCVSLLKPNNAVLAEFSVISAFEVRGREIVECVRYDKLFSDGIVPLPDAIKIDVQGYEYPVLEGFGKTLDNCLGVEMEVHIYPIYEGEKLLGDYVDFLSRFGLYLRKLTPVHHFDGFGVEYDAWFTCGPDRMKTLCEKSVRKVDILERVWDLPERRRIFIPEMFATE